MTHRPQDDPEDFEELVDKSIEDRLSGEEHLRLEELVIGNESARRRYIALLRVHAALAADAASLPRLLEGSDLEPASPSPSPVRFPRAALAAAAVLALAFGAHVFPLSPRPVATLIEASDCRWAGSGLPTIEGAALAPGTLNLVEGLATIRFTSGATLALEAPVSVQILSGMKCRLVAGSLVADVPDSAHGFTIETPDSQVIDHGTRFGVTANELGQSQIFVFEGLVEVDSEAAAAEPQMLRTGQSIRLDSKDLVHGGEPSNKTGAAIAALDGDGWTVIPTSLGAGKDTFVRHDGGGRAQGREPLVMIKHTDLAEGNQRKGYFAFDLSSLAGREIAEARFILDVERSGLGFLAMVPDSRFAVYGLLDESADGWDEQSLLWETAPANTSEGNTLDPNRVVKLGTFDIPRGAGGEPRSISGDALADFLNSDTNAVATLIVVRETGEHEKMGLVHAFASREHPTASPPALRVRTH